LALCAGLTSIRFALQERWELAVAAVVLAGILDGLDGRLARLLKGASKFGAELDSLSDFICFGVAPGFILYQWTLSQLGGVGWILVLGFAVCCALRLARFNTALEKPDRPVWAANFFTGVAAPPAAGLALLLMFLNFQELGEFTRSPYLNGAWMCVVAFLMVSQIPTYSFKRIRVRRDLIMPTLLLVGVGAAALATYPWFVLTLIGFAYLASIPLAARGFARLSREQPEAPAEADIPVAEESTETDDARTFH
jgi:CDP-diacylglycerol--serine O-phosphatidyltransferase